MIDCAAVSFSNRFDSLINQPTRQMQRLVNLLDPDVELEQLAAESAAITRRNFGRTMRIFAPLYLSNECVNNCSYCGFSRDNPIFRTTLTPEQVYQEAKF